MAVGSSEIEVYALAIPADLSPIINWYELYDSSMEKALVIKNSKRINIFFIFYPLF